MTMTLDVAINLLDGFIYLHPKGMLIRQAWDTVKSDLAATKAQTVDIEAIRGVLDILRNAGRYDIYNTDQQACDLADKLADALPKEPT
jgi:hypothetical protein